MKPIILPITEVNSLDFTIVEWRQVDGASVRAGEVLALAETAKGIFDLVAEVDGFLGILVPAGGRGEMQKPVGFIFESDTDRLDWSNKTLPIVTPDHINTINCTAKASELAKIHGINLNAYFLNSGLVTERMVYDLVNVKDQTEKGNVKVVPKRAPEGVRRILLIGGGLGATQVLDILQHDLNQVAIGIIDDTIQIWDTYQHGLPVLGGTDRLVELYKSDVFDAVIVTISTSVAARRRFRLQCEEIGVPLANAIDTSARIASGVKIGVGNVICAFCFVGTHAELGDNNFISAFNSIDHHCRVGSDISTGPGCMLSGSVRIGNSVRMGTGIFVQPKVEIGDSAQIASGAVIIQHIPAAHAVKTKIVTTQVVPVRGNSKI
jgi:acetyltransferase-like isoleucine patch superfamily enzyme